MAEPSPQVRLIDIPSSTTNDRLVPDGKGTRFRRHVFVGTALGLVTFILCLGVKTESLQVGLRTIQTLPGVGTTRTQQHNAIQPLNKLQPRSKPSMSVIKNRVARPVLKDSDLIEGVSEQGLAQTLAAERLMLGEAHPATEHIWGSAVRHVNSFVYPLVASVGLLLLGFFVRAKGQQQSTEPRLAMMEIAVRPDQKQGQTAVFAKMAKEAQLLAEEGKFPKALRILVKLDKEAGEAYIPDAEVRLSVLQALMKVVHYVPNVINPARKIICLMQKSGQPLDPELSTWCLKECIEQRSVENVLDVLEALETASPERIEPSEEIYNELIQMFAFDGKYEEEDVRQEFFDLAFNTLLHMQGVLKYDPSIETLANLAVCALRCKKPETVLSLFQLAEKSGYDVVGIAPSAYGRKFLTAVLISAAAEKNYMFGLRLLDQAAASGAIGKLRKVEDASTARGISMFRSFEEVDSDTEPAPVDKVIALWNHSSQAAAWRCHNEGIREAAAGGLWQQSLHYLDLQKQRGLKPTADCFRNVIKACVANDKVAAAFGTLQRWVKSYKVGESGLPSLSAFNLLLNALTEAGVEGNFEQQVIELMEEVHEAVGNVITFNITLKHFAKTGNVEKSDNVLEAMITQGVEPTVVTYTTILGAYNNAPEPLAAKAVALVADMRQRNVLPNAATINSALRVCLKEKSGESTKCVVELLETELEAESFRPSKQTYRLTKEVLELVDERMMYCEADELEEAIALRAKLQLFLKKEKELESSFEETPNQVEAAKAELEQKSQKLLFLDPLTGTSDFDTSFDEQGDEDMLLERLGLTNE